MSREAHVRFCEGPRVKLPRSTHPYIPMRRGFVYLVAIVDWYSRRVLAWRLSNTLTTDFCIEALEEAITRYGTPEIFNTDQGILRSFYFTNERTLFFPTDLNPLPVV